MFRVLKYLLLVLLVAAPVSAKYWDGAAWVDNTCNYYNGSAWVPCDESYYNGTAWVPVNEGIPPADYTLTVTDPGNNDAITCADTDLSAAISCGNGVADCSATTPVNAEITGMTATAASGRQFNEWGGDITGTENPTTTPLVMNGNKSVTGAFSVTGGEPEMELGYTSLDGTDDTSSENGRAVTITVPPGGITVRYAYVYGSSETTAEIEFGIYTTDAVQVGECSTQSGIIDTNVGWIQVEFTTPIPLTEGEYVLQYHILGDGTDEVRYHRKEEGSNYYGEEDCGIAYDHTSTFQGVMSMANFDAH